MRVLIAQARAAANGGAEAYAAAIAQTLHRDGFSVGTVDIDGHVTPSGRAIRLPGVWPGRILWNWAQVCRALPQIAPHYDRIILAFGEGPDLPIPSLAIRHAPALFATDPRLLAHLGARPTPLRRSYVQTCRRWARYPGRDGANMTLANTRWTACQAIQLDAANIHGILYPPLDIARSFSADRRPFRLLSLGRIAPNKRLEDAVAILNALRHEGLPAELEICGRAQGRYATRLIRRLSAHPHIRLSINADDQIKARALAQATLGLHMFKGEHFGIAVAEMIAAGVLPLVFDDGGVRELVTDPALRFNSTQHATAITSRLLSRPDMRQNSVKVLQRADALTKARDFPTQLRRSLAGFLYPEGQQDAA